MNETNNGGPRIDDLRASIEGRRRDIAETISEIERRLQPGRLRQMAADRLYDATSAWRQDPMGQMEAWGRSSHSAARDGMDEPGGSRCRRLRGGMALGAQTIPLTSPDQAIAVDLEDGIGLLQKGHSDVSDRGPSGGFPRR